ncbi:hypothetical protein CLV30_11330 [Haloactinopolyspora alba]|uniref:Uncharacterized protein n=1 Tax=Haloactinopolyspora alba TaxID=648780 RepID=A0A2P8DWF4_9ACTN|nr:hypothetical protein [Haloactinopolyspora alba]PSL01542.1 hypothetical protein CLV30_11330 [Haloactinopolyspora alba]
MDVEAEISTLFGLPLEEFVAARNALGKRARTDVSADLAARIKALRKPTTTAWLANQLARRHREDVDELVDLGARMREATAARDGDLLRELTARRKELVDALSRAARELAGAAGYGMSDDVASALGETLHAALADPASGEQLRAGRLGRALQHTGFGPVIGGDETADVISLGQARSVREQRRADPTTATPAAPAATPATTPTATPAATPGTGDEGGADEALATAPSPDAARTEPPRHENRRQERDRRRTEASEELERARSAVAAADEHVDELTAALEHRRTQLHDAEATVQRLTDELESARRQLERTRAAVDDTHAELEGAGAEAEAARNRRREATRHLARLDGS